MVFIPEIFISNRTVSHADRYLSKVDDLAGSEFLNVELAQLSFKTCDLATYSARYFFADAFSA